VESEHRQQDYLFEDRFGRPDKGNDTGKVEGLVGYARRNFLVPVPVFGSFEALNAHLLACCCKRMSDRLRGHTDTIGERLERDLAALIPAGDHMVIAETSQTQTPFLIKAGGIGSPVNWLLSGVGARVPRPLPDKEKETILRRLRNSDKPVDRLAHEPKRLEKILAETRQRGYSIRDLGFIGVFYGTAPQDDGLAVIALPLLDGNRVHGAINILWVKTAYTMEDFAGTHLADPQAAAREIVSSLRSPTNRRLAR
jgi:DNA-binding IclR family transcriptional regulator